MTKVYSKEDAKEIKTRINSINLVRENKKANARRDADDFKTDAEIDQLLNHSDKLYYESLLNWFIIDMKEPAYY